MGRGVIFDIKRFALHDGPGIRTTIFFKGCPLRCRWCHNPEGIDHKVLYYNNRRKLRGEYYERTESIGSEMSYEEIMAEIERDRPFFEESAGGVTFSGGEPLVQHALLEELLDGCRERGVHSCVDTSGYAAASVMESIARRADLLLFDLKHPDVDTHKEITGVDLEVIKRNLEIASAHCKRIWIRIPVIPRYNHSVELIDGYYSIIKLAGSSLERVSLLPFHATADHKYKRLNQDNPMSNTSSLDVCDLEPMAERLRSYGLNVVIGG